MLMQIRSSHRKSILGAFNINVTRINTVLRRVHARPQDARKGTTASWHGPHVAGTSGAQLRFHHAVTGTAYCNLSNRRPSACQQQRCFAHRARLERGLGANRRDDDCNSLQDVWKAEMFDEQDRDRETFGEPQREIVQVNNGQIELE